MLELLFVGAPWWAAPGSSPCPARALRAPRRPTRMDVFIEEDP